MKLLDAVNLVMPKLGERPVTSLEAKHPTLAIVLPIIERVRKVALGPGWWFNSYSYTAPVDSNSEITLGADTLSFVPDCGNAAMRGLRLFNTDTLLYTFDGPVKGNIVQDVPFDELPESVATYVFYSALVEAYTTDLGVTQELSLWTLRAGQGFSDMLAEHLRNKKHSTRKSRNWRKLMYALRG